MNELFQSIRRPTVLLKGLIVLVPVVVFFGLLNDHLVFWPTAGYEYRPGRPARVISPGDVSTILRTADPSLRWKITTDTLPFHVTAPRVMQGIRIRGQLQAGTQPVVWLKAEGARDADMYTLASSAFLDSLDWKHVTSGDKTLWMRDKRVTTETVTEGSGKMKKETTKTWTKDVKQFNSVQEFHDNPPENGLVATVGYDRLGLMNLSNVELSNESVTLPQIFRGSHQFYVYSKGGELKISFDKVDRNRKKDSDTLTVRIARADELTARQPRWLKTIRVKDDGNTGGDGPKGNPQKVQLSLPTSAGAYYVEVNTSEDVLLTNLTSSSSMLSFAGRVFLAEGPAYGDKDFRKVNFLTNGSSVTMAPAHDQGKQEVSIANKKYALTGVNVEVKASELSGITSFDINRPDIKISSDGLVTIAPAKIFPSAGTHPLDLLTPDLTNVDYVLAAYRPTKKHVITFDETYAWNELQIQGKQLAFALEAPGLVANRTSLGLQSLRTTLLRGPFPWAKIWQRIGGSLK